MMNKNKICEKLINLIDDIHKTKSFLNNNLNN